MEKVIFEQECCKCFVIKRAELDAPEDGHSLYDEFQDSLREQGWDIKERIQLCPNCKEG